MLICVTKLEVAKAEINACPLVALGFTEYLTETLLVFASGVPIAALNVRAPVEGFIVAKIGSGNWLGDPPIV
jgi:hypothetical protein